MPSGLSCSPLIPGYPRLHDDRTHRISWLRATVLGANDGIVSTASLLLGVAAAHATDSEVLVAGVASLVAGAMSMAAGEYVSVQSQADTEKAELELERAEPRDDHDVEKEELTAIYVARGLDQTLGGQVAEQLTTVDALGAHARDELGITENSSVRRQFRPHSLPPGLCCGSSLAAPSHFSNTLEQD